MVLSINPDKSLITQFNFTHPYFKDKKGAPIRDATINVLFWNDSVNCSFISPAVRVSEILCNASHVPIFLKPFSGKLNGAFFFWKSSITSRRKSLRCPWSSIVRGPEIPFTSFYQRLNMFQVIQFRIQISLNYPFHITCNFISIRPYTWITTRKALRHNIIHRIHIIKRLRK